MITSKQVLFSPNQANSIAEAFLGFGGEQTINQEMQDGIQKMIETAETNSHSARALKNIYEKTVARYPIPYRRLMAVFQIDEGLAKRALNVGERVYMS